MTEKLLYEADVLIGGWVTVERRQGWIIFSNGESGKSFYLTLDEASELANAIISELEK